jgi:hypothetical protein
MDHELEVESGDVSEGRGRGHVIWAYNAGEAVGHGFGVQVSLNVFT